MGSAWAPKVVRQSPTWRQFTEFRIACCSCFALALHIALALLIAVMIRPSREVPQTCPPFLGFTQFVHPSRCSRSTLTTVCFCCCFCYCFCVSESAASAPDPSSALRLHLVVECGIHGLLEYHSAKLNNIAVLKQRLASFLLDTEVFVLNLFVYPKISHIFVFPLLFCFQSIRQRFLRFSNIQSCRFLN